MFSRVSSILLLVLTVFALFATTTATVTVTVTPPAPGPTTTPLPASQCGTGKLHCCDALERSDGSVVGLILGLLGVVLQGVEALIGIHCVPIDILGIGQGVQCHHQPVCCQNNDFDGIVVIACVPVNINL